MNHIYVPQDWCELVLNGCRNNPFMVTEMTREDFMPLEPVAKSIVNSKVNTFKQKVEWLNIKWILVTKNKPVHFQYRFTLNDLENWKRVDLRKRGKGKPSSVGRIQLPNLYSGPRVIKEAKKKDLLQYIPPINHSFYHGLIEGEEESEVTSESEENDGRETVHIE